MKGKLLHKIKIVHTYIHIISFHLLFFFLGLMMMIFQMTDDHHLRKRNLYMHTTTLEYIS